MHDLDSRPRIIVNIDLAYRLADTIRSLTSADEDPSILEKHLLTEDGQPYLSPLTASSTSHAYSSSSSSSSDEPGWHWNRAKYRVEGRALSDVVDALARDMQSLDTIHKQKVSAYNAAKGQLAVLQRKQTGNLATKDLSSVLTSPPSSEDVSSSSSSTTPLSLSNSEYLEITYVAVPKNSIKDFEAKYERLASMVVPRSAVRLAQDEEYALYSVTIFKRVRDEFNQKCREDKFIVRDFTYDRASMEKQRHEFDELQASEKDLWTDLLRISRINFAEAFSLVIHLKVVASYVECVLRYGLPADYFICAVSPDGKNAKKALSTLSSYFETFTPDVNSSTARRVGGSGSDGKKNKNRSKVGSSSSSAAIDENALVGEFQNLLEQEVFEFVLQEVPTYTSANADSR